jgi:beta-glucosidase
MAARLRDLVLNRFPFYLLERTGKGKFDYIGLNYYCRTLICWELRGTGILFGRDWLADDQGATRRYSELGWEAFAPGFKEQLRAFARYGVPIVVTENGIATDDEALRVDYLRSHLATLAEAIAEGVPVKGYFYWSLMDNYEWAAGTRPHFGLCRVDYATQRREPRPVAEHYASVCRSGVLPDSDDRGCMPR